MTKHTFIADVFPFRVYEHGVYGDEHALIVIHQDGTDHTGLCDAYDLESVHEYAADFVTFTPVA